MISIFSFILECFSAGQRNGCKEPGIRQDTDQRKTDWDPRVKDRISKLTPTEIGYQKITSLKMNGIRATGKTSRNHFRS